MADSQSVQIELHASILTEEAQRFYRDPVGSLRQVEAFDLLEP